MLHHQTALLKLPREHYNRITQACRHPVGRVTDLRALRRPDPVQGFADEGMVQERRHTRRPLAAAGFRVIPDEEGPIEEVVDLLSDYRPHLIALCSRLDGPTARTLAEVKEPARRLPRTPRKVPRRVPERVRLSLEPSPQLSKAFDRLVGIGVVVALATRVDIMAVAG